MHHPVSGINLLLLFANMLINGEWSLQHSTDLLTHQLIISLIINQYFILFHFTLKTHR